jgi:hypothetical protein
MPWCCGVGQTLPESIIEDSRWDTVIWLVRLVLNMDLDPLAWVSGEIDDDSEW